MLRICLVLNAWVKSNYLYYKHLFPRVLDSTFAVAFSTFSTFSRFYFFLTTLTFNTKSKKRQDECQYKVSWFSSINRSVNEKKFSHYFYVRGSFFKKIFWYKRLSPAFNCWYKFSGNSSLWQWNENFHLQP